MPYSSGIPRPIRDSAAWHVQVILKWNNGRANQEILCGYQVGNWTLGTTSSRSKSNTGVGRSAPIDAICRRDRLDKRKRPRGGRTGGGGCGKGKVKTIPERDERKRRKRKGENEDGEEAPETAGRRSTSARNSPRRVYGGDEQSGWHGNTVRTHEFPCSCVRG